MMVMGPTATVEATATTRRVQVKTMRQLQQQVMQVMAVMGNRKLQQSQKPNRNRFLQPKLVHSSRKKHSQKQKANRKNSNLS
jgi:hypothetical protein